MYYLHIVLFFIYVYIHIHICAHVYILGDKRQSLSEYDRKFPIEKYVCIWLPVVQQTSFTHAHTKTTQTQLGNKEEFKMAELFKRHFHTGLSY